MTTLLKFEVAIIIYADVQVFRISMIISDDDGMDYPNPNDVQKQNRE